MTNQQAPKIRLSDCSISYEGASQKKNFGLIALATDLTSEPDFVQLMPHDQVGIYTTRVAYENPTTPESLRDMAPRLCAAADQYVLCFFHPTSLRRRYLALAFPRLSFQSGQESFGAS